jgi:transcription-repair coupling factor (superfamily II helicase)
MNMAISKIYSISTLQTPPKLRLPIKTRVEYYNFEIIKEAISFEINRGGQVYFVHNDVTSIKSLTALVGSWFKKSVVAFIHGQESPGTIEEKMVSFVDGGIDVLICTTIIESGIDVPRANCIIINNSHLFGLAQLYQMRGRVGRGHHQAYAYLLIPRGLSLSEKSFRRIKSIEQNVSLGSGFNVSMADMEIRGAGSLFGYKQSGGAGSLGYEMYTKMIQRSLHESGKLDVDFKLLPEDVFINIYSGGLIPEKYISIESIRLSVYKSISIASRESELDNLVFNLEDRFGPLPQEVIKLIRGQKLRLAASRVGVNSITRGSCGIIFSMSDLDSGEYVKSFIDYVFLFFNKNKYKHHILPAKGLVFSVCIHLDKGEDIYTFFLRFLGKFARVNQ